LKEKESPAQENSTHAYLEIEEETGKYKKPDENKSKAMDQE